MGIYVEILIRAPLDELWRYTQNPSLHQRWDLRFTRIEYLPRESEGAPQRFRYSTRIGGVEISGEGESTGSRDLPGGERASSLKFWSDDPRSLIREGSGYWKYIPTADGVRFLTWYDYQTRFGILGRLFDRVLFRPLMGWATAWSFDALRLWLERGVLPETSCRRALTHAVARLALVFEFAWQGIVPKLITHNADEIRLLSAAGIPAGQLPSALTALGLGEVLLAIVLLLFWRSRFPAMLSILFVAVATLFVALSAPQYISAAFNPVTLNFGVAVLALIDLLNDAASPSARNCLRQKPSNL